VWFARNRKGGRRDGAVGCFRILLWRCLGGGGGWHSACTPPALSKHFETHQTSAQRTKGMSQGEQFCGLAGDRTEPTAETSLRFEVQS
jgi:hypothetical protein